MHFKINKNLFFTTFLLSSVIAYSKADTYKYTNESGISVITNKPSPNATTFSRDDVNALNSQIQQINQEISAKQQKKQQIDAALRNSQSAISKSAQLLKQLQAKRDADIKQIEQLQVTIPQMNEATTQAKQQVSKSISNIYQQLKEIDSQQQSFLSGNDALDSERKRIYLTRILQVQNDKYIQLSQKLNQLQDLNSKLQAEVDRLSGKLGETSRQHDELLAHLGKTQEQSQSVQEQIIKDKAKLSDLKQRQAQLNKLLKQIAAQEKKARAQQLAAAKKQQANNTTSANHVNNGKTQVVVVKSASNNLKQSAPDSSVEDDSPFMSRKLTKPVSGSISVGFGQMRDSVRNNGVLLSVADNIPVYSVSSGSVMFSGDLPGFGQILVIDNGDNYTSVYSGILAQVKKGAKVSAGQQIASSGNSNNQPMGGVYFELRHLGKPVNPSALF